MRFPGQHTNKEQAKKRGRWNDGKILRKEGVGEDVNPADL
jgi:hypothetical protein